MLLCDVDLDSQQRHIFSDLPLLCAVVVNREGELEKTVEAIAAVIEAEKLKVKGLQLSSQHAHS